MAARNSLFCLVVFQCFTHTYIKNILASLQLAVLLFNLFSDCSVHETLEKYLSKKQCKLWKIVSNLAALFSFLQRMPLETR